MENEILEVCKKIPSGNAIIRNHWAVNARNKKEWCLLVRNQMKLRKIEKARAKKYILMIISYRKRLLDKDNLYTGVKSLLDACVMEGLIFDDSPDYVDLNIAQYIAKEYQTIIIRK